VFYEHYKEFSYIVSQGRGVLEWVVISNRKGLGEILNVNFAFTTNVKAFFTNISMHKPLFLNTHNQF